MRVALDYDAVARDRDLWIDFIRQCTWGGHEVMVVTSRGPNDAIDPVIASLVRQRVHYTDGLAKWSYLAVRGISIDVWIDCRPTFILNDGRGEEARALD